MYLNEDQCSTKAEARAMSAYTGCSLSPDFTADWTIPFLDQVRIKELSTPQRLRVQSCLQHVALGSRACDRGLGQQLTGTRGLTKLPSVVMSDHNDCTSHSTFCSPFLRRVALFKVLSPGERTLACAQLPIQVNGSPLQLHRGL